MGPYDEVAPPTVIARSVKRVKTISFTSTVTWRTVLPIRAAEEPISCVDTPLFPCQPVSGINSAGSFQSGHRSTIQALHRWLHREWSVKEYRGLWAISVYA